MSNAKISNFVITTAFLSATLLNPAVIYNREARVISFAGAAGTTTIPVKPTPVANQPLFSGESLEVTNQKNCNDSKKEASTAESEYQTACQSVLKIQASPKKSSNTSSSSMATACKKKLTECVKNQSQENDTPFRDMLTGAVTAQNSEAGAFMSSVSDDSTDSTVFCPEYNATTFKTAKDDLQREFEKAQTDLDTKNTALSTAQKEGTDKIEKLKGDILEDRKNFEKELNADKENERNEINSIKGQSDKLNASIRENQSKILATQAKKSAIVGDRNTKVEGYKLELIGCKSTALQRQAEARKNSNTAGSLATANSRGSGSASDVKTIWSICVNAVLKKRSAESEMYRNQMQSIDLELNQLSQDMQEKQKSIALLNQQAGQAANDRNLKRQQDAANYNQSYAAKTNQLQQMAALFQQDANNIAVRLAQLEGQVNAKSNELSKLKKQAPRGSTKYNSEDASEKLNKYLSAARAVVGSCASIDAEKKTVKKYDDELKEVGGAP